MLWHPEIEAGRLNRDLNRNWASVSLQFAQALRPFVPTGLRLAPARAYVRRFDVLPLSGRLSAETYGNWDARFEFTTAGAALASSTFRFSQRNPPNTAAPAVQFVVGNFVIAVGEKLKREGIQRSGLHSGKPLLKFWCQPQPQQSSHKAAASLRSGFFNLLLFPQRNRGKARPSTGSCSLFRYWNERLSAVRTFHALEINPRLLIWPDAGVALWADDVHRRSDLFPIQFATGGHFPG